MFATYPDKLTTQITPLQRPPLTLLLGRAAVLKTRKPRPDDPLPRGPALSPPFSSQITHSSHTNRRVFLRFPSPRVQPAPNDLPPRPFLRRSVRQPQIQTHALPHVVPPFQEGERKGEASTGTPLGQGPTKDQGTTRSLRQLSQPPLWRETPSPAVERRRPLLNRTPFRVSSFHLDLPPKRDPSLRREFLRRRARERRPPWLADAECCNLVRSGRRGRGQ